MFELNEALRKRAFLAASGAKLSDTEEAAKYRRLYPMAAARSPPGVTLVSCTVIAGIELVECTIS